MSDRSDVLDEPKDTSALDPQQLSDQELTIILEIESRLKKAKNTNLAKEPQGPARYLKNVQNRHSRVLLLDGGRGTGKTSLLLTLVQRWHHKFLGDDALEKELVGAYRTRIQNSKSIPHESADEAIPTHVKVLDILDFDPLPPGMPLIAGIVQVWRSLAQEYDRRLGPIDDEYEADGGFLMDRWYNLFQTAAAGWGTLSHNKSLIEQVLDRQEQVENWQKFGDDWGAFIDEVIKRGKNLKDSGTLSSESVFVIMIDDCDLQVTRIRQLLPALRMLYHPKVFFIVAADRRHMTEMLKLDFYGQQIELARHQNAKPDSLWQLVEGDQWARELANSSVNKVFPLKNRWRLRKLSFHELLDFPYDQDPTVRTILDVWPQQVTKERTIGDLGKYLAIMSGGPDDPIELPPIMPYREAHQIVHYASAQADPKLRALEAIRHLIGRTRSEDLVRISKRRKQSSAGERDDPDPDIEYLAVGEIIALFHRGLREPIGDESEIVLSARPAFRYRNEASRTTSLLHGEVENEDEIISALVASSLRDDGYGVVAPGLVWDIRLALAWTETRVVEMEPSLDLALRWQLHEHPSPLRLLTWTKEWRDFIHDLSVDRSDLPARIAYAWIYHQLKWMREDLQAELPGGLKEISFPLDKKINAETSWQQLLALEPETGSEIAYWKSRTLPLMARPELGLPEEVQNLLLAPEGVGIDTDWLRDQRRRRITDAIVAAAEQRGVRAEGAENQQQAEEVTQIFEARYKKIYGADSPWCRRVEDPAKAISTRN